MQFIHGGSSHKVECPVKEVSGRLFRDLPLPGAAEERTGMSRACPGTSDRTPPLGIDSSFSEYCEYQGISLSSVDVMNGAKRPFRYSALSARCIITRADLMPSQRRGSGSHCLLATDELTQGV